MHGTPGQRSSSIERAGGAARWRFGGRARKDEVVGSTGFVLVVGEEGREEATMDREEKVVGPVCKSRRWVDRLDGWIEGIPRRRWVCGGGGMGRMGQDA